MCSATTVSWRPWLPRQTALQAGSSQLTAAAAVPAHCNTAAPPGPARSGPRAAARGGPAPPLLGLPSNILNRAIAGAVFRCELYEVSVFGRLCSDSFIESMQPQWNVSFTGIFLSSPMNLVLRDVDLYACGVVRAAMKFNYVLEIQQNPMSNTKQAKTRLKHLKNTLSFMNTHAPSIPEPRKPKFQLLSRYGPAKHF